MARSEKPALRLSEIRRLSSEEGWDNVEIAMHFGIKAIDISRIRSEHGIQKKRVFKPRYTLVLDEEEVTTETTAETPTEPGITSDVVIGEPVEQQEEETISTEEVTAVASVQGEDSSSTGW